MESGALEENILTILAGVICSVLESFAVDTDIMDAFDQVDVLNKAAQIYISAKNMGFEPEGMTDAQMHELSTVFGLPK